jgi:predicted dehydrogenase
MKNKIRFAIIGCGAIAHKHITALGKNKRTEIVGAYDIIKNVSKSFSRQYNIACFNNIEELVKKTAPDVFCVLTPSGSHADTILELVKYKKHCVVEKPLALRLDQIDNILQESDKKGIKIFVVQQNRFNPPIQKLKQAMDDDRFGKLVLGTARIRWSRDQSYYDQKVWRGTWAFDGGVLTNQASHHVDMLLWLMGDVESVMAKTSRRLVEIEAEDTGVAIFKFSSGALGIIEATTATRPKDLEGSISILGENGAVEIGGFFMNELKTWNFSIPKDMDEDIWEHHSRVPNEPAWNHTEFYRDVINSLDNGQRGLIDGLEGRKSVELINAIYESSETGKEVFLRFRPQECRLGVINDK